MKFQKYSITVYNVIYNYTGSIMCIYNVHVHRHTCTCIYIRTLKESGTIYIHKGDTDGSKCKPTKREEG